MTASTDAAGATVSLLRALTSTSQPIELRGGGVGEARRTLPPSRAISSRSVICVIISAQLQASSLVDLPSARVSDVGGAGRRLSAHGVEPFHPRHHHVQDVGRDSFDSSPVLNVDCDHCSLFKVVNTVDCWRFVSTMNPRCHRDPQAGFGAAVS
jgi:hypothetical protein